MSFSFGPCLDFVRQGAITSSTVPDSHSSDHDCKPEGVLGYCHLEVAKNGNVIVVRLGRHRVLDELTANKISGELLGMVDRPDCQRLLLDFSDVAQLSSTMLTTLVKLHRRMVPKGEKLRLCGLNPQLRSVFATTRLDCLFDIIDIEAKVLTPVAPQSPPITT
jgi:anti-sigma B factor antagonist